MNGLPFGRNAMYTRSLLTPRSSNHATAMSPFALAASWTLRMPVRVVIRCGASNVPSVRPKATYRPFSS